MRRRRLTTSLVATTLAAALLPAAAADGAVVHVVRGAGFGHGVGMSQFGAEGMARHGRGHRRILAHYYRGTRVGTVEPRAIRVLLQSGPSEIRFRGASFARGERLNRARTYRATPSGGRIALRTAGGRLVGAFPSPLRVTSLDGAVTLLGTSINGVTDGLYRGALEIRPGDGGLVAVNAAGLEDYVQGVVPGEVSAGWHPETLRAQAIAARSYALVTNRGGDVFDQYPDTRSQVYRGANAEDPRTNAAVQATAGKVVQYRGRVIPTYFFSTSGGRTENVEDVFYGAAPRPYLVAVKDPFDDLSPRHRWRFTFTRARLERRLGSLVKGRLRRIDVTRRGQSPRVVLANVVGSGGTTRVRGATLKALLGLPDTWAHFTRVSTYGRSNRGEPSWTSKMLLERSIVGSVRPRPRGRRVLVERRDPAGRFRRERAASLDSRGRFVVSLRRPGTYRVRTRQVTGPAAGVR